MARARQASALTAAVQRAGRLSWTPGSTLEGGWDKAAAAGMQQMEPSTCTVVAALFTPPPPPLPVRAWEAMLKEPA